MMTFISRGLSIKDFCIVGEGRVVKNGQRWTESNTLSSKKNLNIPFEDTRLVADR